MELKEYNERLNKIETDFKSAKNNLHIEYGLSQAIYKIGDIIKDSRFTFKVDRITVYVSFGIPEPVYHGVELKKDLTPKKNGTRAAIYGNHGIEIVKKA